MADTATNVENKTEAGESRRDFLLLATSAVGVAGTAAAIWPFVDSMNPSADVLALSTTEVDIISDRRRAKRHSSLAWETSICSSP